MFGGKIFSLRKIIKTDTEQLIDDLMVTKAKYELRVKEEQLAVALLRVSVLRKKINIIKKRNKILIMEIKIRAWDGVKMLYPEDVDMISSRLTSGQLLDAYPNTAMLFTGLKDKNGEEVYCGDLLRYPSSNDFDKNNYICYEVFYHDGDESGGVGFKINRAYHQGSVCGGYIPRFIPTHVSKMIICGNKFESIELMREK